MVDVFIVNCDCEGYSFAYTNGKQAYFCTIDIRTNECCCTHKKNVNEVSLNEVLLYGSYIEIKKEKEQLIQKLTENIGTWFSI